MLDTIHNQGLKICLGAFRTSPMESLYVEANEESLHRRRERLSLQYALKVKLTLYAIPYSIQNVLIYSRTNQMLFLHLVFTFMTFVMVLN